MLFIELALLLFLTIEKVEFTCRIQSGEYVSSKKMLLINNIK